MAPWWDWPSRGCASGPQPPTFASVGRMIVSIKLNIAEGSVYTEELSNFLGTQAALMQSGVVINRRARAGRRPEPEAADPTGGAESHGSAQNDDLRAAGHGRRPGIRAGIFAGRMDEYIALKKEMRTQTSDTTVAGLTEEVMRLEKELRNADAGSGCLPEHQQRRAVPGPRQQRRQLPGGAQPAPGRPEIRVRTLADADGGPEPGPPAGGRRGVLPTATGATTGTTDSRQRPAATEPTRITSRRNSSCCCCRPNSRSWAAT